VTKILLILLFTWLLLTKIQQLLSRWRIRRTGDPGAELILRKDSGWNFFLQCFFGFFRFIVVVLSALLVILYYF